MLTYSDAASTLGLQSFLGRAMQNQPRNVLPYALVYGNPARLRGWMSTHGHRLAFDATGHATCPESGQHYQLTDGHVAVLSS